MSEWCEHISWCDTLFRFISAGFKATQVSFFSFCPICGKPRPPEKKKLCHCKTVKPGECIGVSQLVPPICASCGEEVQYGKELPKKLWEKLRTMAMSHSEWTEKETLPAYWEPFANTVLDSVMEVIEEFKEQRFPSGPMCLSYDLLKQKLNELR